MSAPYGNGNFPFSNYHQYLTYDGNKASVALDKTTQQVSLIASTDCWVLVGAPGVEPVAVKSSAEKVKSTSFRLHAATTVTIAVPIGTDKNPVKIAAIKDATTGSLDIYEHSGS